MLKRSLLPVLVLIVSLFAFSEAYAFKADLPFTQENVSLERNGVKLHLERMTLANTAPEKQILLVHGLTYSSHEFDVDYADYSLARFLATQGYAVWRLDIAGYGSSAEVSDGFMPNSDYAAEDIAAAVRTIIGKSKQQKIDVLGWSWGTVTSSRFVAKYPEHVRKLVLYAPILTGLGAHDVTNAFNHNTWEHAAGDFQVLKDGTIDYSICEPAVVATFQSNAWRYDKESSPNGGRKDLLVADTQSLIPFASLKVPTMVIYGDKDPYINMKAMEKTKELAKTLSIETKFVVLDGAAHAMMMEQPYYRPFREAVLGFLAK